MGGIRERLAGVLGSEPTRVSPLGAGATGSVSLVELRDGTRVVAKVSDRVERGASGAAIGLEIEARMLRLLAERSALPVPRVIHAEPDLLVMEYKPGKTSFDDAAEEHAAELLAALHAVRSADGRYGLEFDGLIGPLHQPDAWCASWVEFWRERRVLHMTHEGAREGRVPTGLAARLERLAGRLGELIPETPAAALIHGDVWSGNVLAERGRITAFLDPAPYYAHHEVELAFITMFSTFGAAFFERYSACGTRVEPDFLQRRRHVYVVYPLLVHVRLFGGGYVSELDSTLGMLGF